MLDFATGCGAAAVAAKRAGARSVLLNDIDPWSTLIAEMNMGINDDMTDGAPHEAEFDTDGSNLRSDFELRATTHNLIGRTAEQIFRNDTAGASSAPRVVLAGDVCYEEVLAGQVIDWLRNLAAHDGVTVSRWRESR